MSDILLKALKDNNPDDVLFLENAFFKDEAHISASLVARRKDILELVYIYMDQLLNDYHFDKDYYLVADNTVDSVALLIAMVTLNLHPIIIPANMLKNDENIETIESIEFEKNDALFFMPIHNASTIAENKKIFEKSKSIYAQLERLGIEYSKNKNTKDADIYIISSGSISGHSTPYPIDIQRFIDNSTDSKLYEKRILNNQFQVSYSDISNLSGFVCDILGPLFFNTPANLIDYKNNSILISVRAGKEAMRMLYCLDVLNDNTIDYKKLVTNLSEYIKQKNNLLQLNDEYASFYRRHSQDSIEAYHSRRKLVIDFILELMEFYNKKCLTIREKRQIEELIVNWKKIGHSTSFSNYAIKYINKIDSSAIDIMFNEYKYSIISKIRPYKKGVVPQRKTVDYLRYDTIDEYPDKIGFAFMNFFSKEEENRYRYNQFFTAFGSSLMLPVDFFYTLSDNDDLKECDYKYLITAGSPLSSFKCKQVKKALGSNNETKILNTFGMTQSNGVITCFDAAETPDIYFSLLYLMNGKIKEVEKDSLFAIKLIPIAKSTDYNENKLRTTSNLVGELIINGEHTGDLSFEHNGYIYFVSRMHDIIKANNKLNVALLEQYFQELVNNYVIVQRIYKEDNDSIEIVLIDNEIDDIEEKKQIIDNFMYRYFNDIEYKVVISTINDIRMSNNLGKSIKDGSSLLR